MRDAVLFTLAVLSRERLPMRVRHNGLRTGIRQFFPLTQNADCYLDAAAISMTRTRQNAKVTPPEKDRIVCYAAQRVAITLRQFRSDVNVHDGIPHHESVHETHGS